MASGFVSQNELEEERARRQEEWEKVRKPDDPVVAPEVEVCNKSLFEQLRENKDKKQSELDEAKKFKNMIRGVDEDESEFLAMVDNKKFEEQRRRKQEEQELLASIANTVIPATEPSLSAIIAKPVPSNTSGLKNKQAALLSLAIKRKSNSTDCPPQKVSKQEEASSSKDGGDCSKKDGAGEKNEPTSKPSTVVKVIPGLALEYSSSDDSSSDAEDTTSSESK